MQEVSALADRIVIIAKGRIVAEGTTDSILAQAGAANLEDAFFHLTEADPLEPVAPEPVP